MSSCHFVALIFGKDRMFGPNSVLTFDARPFLFLRRRRQVGGRSHFDIFINICWHHYLLRFTLLVAGARDGVNGLIEVDVVEILIVDRQRVALYRRQQQELLFVRYLHIGNFFEGHAQAVKLDVVLDVHHS